VVGSVAPGATTTFSFTVVAPATPGIYNFQWQMVDDYALTLQAKLENLIDGVEEPDRETFETMLVQVERLGRLVQQLLDLSRLEAGVVPLERSPFPVEPLLEHAVREQRLQQSAVDVAVRVDPADLTADGDPERVHQVVANLLENAVRHTPPGTHIRASTGAENGEAVLTVEDDGPGISLELERRVFERFVRGVRDGARGSGLGLAIVRAVADAHSGTVSLERPPRGSGTRFVIRIPAVQSPAASPAKAR